MVKGSLFTWSLRHKGTREGISWNGEERKDVEKKMGDLPKDKLGPPAARFMTPRGRMSGGTEGLTGGRKEGEEDEKGGVEKREGGEKRNQSGKKGFLKIRIFVRLFLPMIKESTHGPRARIYGRYNALGGGGGGGACRGIAGETQARDQ